MDWISELLLKEAPAQMRILLSQILHTSKGVGNTQSECYYGVWLEFLCVQCLSSKQIVPSAESGSIFIRQLKKRRKMSSSFARLWVNRVLDKTYILIDLFIYIYLKLLW